MRIRGRLMGSVLAATVSPELCHGRYGYPLLQAQGRWGTLVIPWEDAALFDLVEATAAERLALADAGYELAGAA
jgi:hypothetical protein